MSSRDLLHSCQTCRTRFSSKLELEKHELCHSGSRPLTCRLCYKKFGTELELNNHLFTKHLVRRGEHKKESQKQLCVLTFILY